MISNKRNSIKNKKMDVQTAEIEKADTLLVDGNYLLKRAYSNFANKGDDILYHFLMSVRSTIKNNNFNKCVVFWDGNNGGILRQKLYEGYKGNRETKEWYKGELSLYEKEKIREKKEAISLYKSYIQNCLQHLYIRQIEVNDHEADDLIAEYCSMYHNEENITLFTNDRDLLQILSIADNISVILGNIYITDEYNNRSYVSINRKNINKYVNIDYRNIAVGKIFCGDGSDNIKGIKGFGDKTLLKYADLTKKEYAIDEIYNNILVDYDNKANMTNFCGIMGFTNDDWKKLNSMKLFIKDNNIVRISLDKNNIDIEVDDAEYKIIERYVNKCIDNKIDISINELIKKMKFDKNKYSFIETICSFYKKYSDYTDIFQINEEIIDLVNKRKITEEAIEHIRYMNESILDIEDRGAKYLFPILMETDFFSVYNNNYPTNKQINKNNLINFCTPFIGLVKREQNLTKMYS